MNKFKAGDEVICIKSYNGWLTIGKTYKIINFNIYNIVRGDNFMSGGFGDEYFKLAPQKFRVGMRVWGLSCGWTTIEKVLDGEPLPIKTKSGYSYTKDGKRFDDDLRPSLFLDEIKPEDWPNPPAPKPHASELKPGQNIMVKYGGDDEYTLRMVAFVSGENVWSYNIFSEKVAYLVDSWRLPTEEENNESV